MMTRYEAWLNKKSLSAIDPSIYILDIAYASPRFLTDASDIPGRNGQRVSGRYARTTSVVITIEIHEHDTARRQEVCRRVQAWAMKGGMLTTNDRRGQRLRVICDSPPDIASALKWTQPIKMTMTAYEQPFWEDEFQRSASVSGMNATKAMYVPGIGAQTRVEASAKNLSGSTIDALTLKAGGTTFDFAGLGLGAGETLEIGYDENDLLTIHVGDVSKMSCRTGNSDDDLMLTTGKTENVSVYSGGEVSATFKARGLYL